MPKKPDEIPEAQEIKQEERELRREYYIFLPILLFVVLLIAFTVTKAGPQSVVELVPASGNSGFWLVYDNGEVKNFGTASPVDKIELAEEAKIVAAQASDEGFWAVTNKGSINAVAGADYAGEIDPIISIDGVVELMANPTGRSYRIIDKDGPVFAFNATPLNGGDVYDKPVASAATTSTGEGYWIFQPNGELSTFGDAANFDSIDLNDNEVVVDAASYSEGAIVLTNKGRLIILGDGSHHGDLSSQSFESPVIDIDPLTDGSGYRITSMDGNVKSFGSAQTL